MRNKHFITDNVGKIYDKKEKPNIFQHFVHVLKIIFLPSLRVPSPPFGLYLNIHFHFNSFSTNSFHSRKSIVINFLSTFFFLHYFCFGSHFFLYLYTYIKHIQESWPSTTPVSEFSLLKNKSYSYSRMEVEK